MCLNKSLLNKIIAKTKAKRAPVFKIKKKLGDDAFKNLIFIFLSSRTKDEKTLAVTLTLFNTFPNAKAIANAKLCALEKLLYGVAFYKVKARRLKNIASYIANNGIPKTFDELIKLPGIGRKTANVFLASIKGKNVIGVDTHVHRISNRLGLVKTKTPIQTEKALNKIIPNELKPLINIAFVSLGQTICLPRNPKCEECPLNYCCKKIGVKH